MTFKRSDAAHGRKHPVKVQENVLTLLKTLRIYDKILWFLYLFVGFYGHIHYMIQLFETCFWLAIVANKDHYRNVRNVMDGLYYSILVSYFCPAYLWSVALQISKQQWVIVGWSVSERPLWNFSKAICLCDISE